ncbi:hypothetical protein F9K78_07065 [Brucella pseudintermedia]|nr:hypothetical protein F9K78_07065 [Brucella pseudintermedia]
MSLLGAVPVLTASSEQLHLFVFQHFRTQNRFTLLLEMLWRRSESPRSVSDRPWPYVGMSVRPYRLQTAIRNAVSDRRSCFRGLFPWSVRRKPSMCLSPWLAVS